jgi:D-tyrosyl-tRNA(Tyr) deacylase
MRVVLQRVERAAVRVGAETVGSIGVGLLLLVGVGHGDDRLDLAGAARKILDLRVFQDREGKMNLSLRDVGGDVLAVSQFTLYGDTRKGRRPSYTHAAPPEVAEPVFDAFVRALQAEGVRVAVGRFGARMSVELVNDGPVTLVLELAPSGPEG